MTRAFAKEFKPYLNEELFHYCPTTKLDRIESIIVENRIYLQSPNNFNDPFDCKPNLVMPGTLSKDKYLHQYIRSKFPELTSKEVKAKLPYAKKQFTHSNLIKIYEDFVAATGVFCLSEKIDNLLLWAHYADSHRGICYIFKANESQTIFWEALKVKYQEKPPQIDPTKFTTEKEELLKSLLLKSQHWSYEQEMRIIRTKFEGGCGYAPFISHLLKGIVLGLKTSNSAKKSIIEMVKNSSREIQIYYSELNKTEYRLDIKKLL